MIRSIGRLPVLLFSASALGALAGCGNAPAVAGRAAATTMQATAATMPPTPTATASTGAPTASRANTPPARWPGYVATVGLVTAADLPHSWHAGCPTPPAQLRALTVRYVDFGGAPRLGTLVVNADAVRAVTTVFADLYAHRFPIRRMVPIDAYDGSDPRSTAADNTAAFNCRAAVATGPPSWSEHAFGEAVDVNPVENPYLEGGQVLPPAGAAFAYRAGVRPGMAEPGGELVAAFARQGWHWGGAFSDYQHFSVNGK